MIDRNVTRPLDETREQQYWQNQYTREGYYEPGHTYDDYGPAYRTGYLGYGRYQGRSFDAAEHELKTDWERTKGESRLAWDKAKNAVRAAWHRVETAMPGDADGDGR